MYNTHCTINPTLLYSNTLPNTTTHTQTLLPPQNTRKLTEPAAPEKEPAAPPPVLREQPLASPAAYPAPVHEVPETEHATTVTVTAEPSVPRRHVPPLRIDVDDDHGLHVRREAQPLKQRNSEVRKTCTG